MQDEFKKMLSDLMKKQEKHERQQRYVRLDKYADDYVEAFVPEHAPIEQIMAIVDAFKAGALAGFETLYNAFDPLQKMKEDSDEYQVMSARIQEHLRRWQDDMSKIACALFIKHMKQETGAEVHMMHASEALVKLIDKLIERYEHDDDDTDANGDKMRDDPPEPQHDHRKPPEHG